jgi:hypothetical protein
MRATAALLMGCFIAGCLQPSRVSRSEELSGELLEAWWVIGGPDVTVTFRLAPGVDPEVASRKIEKYLRENPDNAERFLLASSILGRGEWACALADVEGLHFGFPNAISDVDLEIMISELLYAVKLKRMGPQGVPMLIRTVLDEEASCDARCLAIEVLRDARDKRAIPALAVVAGQAGPINVKDMDYHTRTVLMAREALAHTIEPDALTWIDELYDDCDEKVETWYRTWRKNQPPEVPGRSSGDTHP